MSYAIPFIILAAVAAYSLLGIAASDSLAFRLSDYGNFEYFHMTNPGTVRACTAVPAFVSVPEVRVHVLYGSEGLGSMSFGPLFFLPGSDAVAEAEFSSHERSSVQYILLAIDSQNAGASPVRIDPSLLTIVTDVQTRILGIIPYGVQKAYQGYEFSDLMNSGARC